MKKNKELQEANSIINNQKEKINILNTQHKDEIDALQKTLQSNKCALEAMKKTLDNEKAFRICADQEIKNLKEQLKCMTVKYNSLENENEKIINEKFKIEEVQNKIKQQCNELLQKNISLENHCEKKELAFDEQINSITKLENTITELREKIDHLNETEEENSKLVKQIKQLSKQMETYENEREMYLQRLEKIQREENELKCIIKDFKREIDLKNDKINTLSENNSDLSSKYCVLSNNLNNLQTNFTNCLKLLDEIFDNYVKNQDKQNIKSENEHSLKLEPFLNETFELFEQTLMEYKLLKSSYKESMITLKDEIDKKDIIIKSFKDETENHKQEIIKHEIINSYPPETNNGIEELNHFQTQSNNVISNKLILNDELDKSLMYINTMKHEILPKQKLLVTECKKFMLEKIEEIENLNISKNNYVKNVLTEIEHLKKEIIDKNSIINQYKTEVLKLGEKITEKDTLCNEMETELHQLRDNFGT